MYVVHGQGVSMCARACMSDVRQCLVYEERVPVVTIYMCVCVCACVSSVYVKCYCQSSVYAGEHLRVDVLNTKYATLFTSSYFRFLWLDDFNI